MEISLPKKVNLKNLRLPQLILVRRTNLKLCQIQFKGVKTAFIPEAGFFNSLQFVYKLPIRRSLHLHPIKCSEYSRIVRISSYARNYTVHGRNLRTGRSRPDFGPGVLFFVEC